MSDRANGRPFVNAVSGPFRGRFPGSKAVKRPFVSGKDPVKTPFPAFPTFNGSGSAKATAHYRAKRAVKAVSAISDLSALSVKAPFNRAVKGGLNRSGSLSVNRSVALSGNRSETAETAVGTALNRVGGNGRFSGSGAVSVNRETGVSGKRGAVPQNTPFGLTRSTAGLSGQRGDGLAQDAVNAQKHPLAVAARIGGAS